MISTGSVDYSVHLKLFVACSYVSSFQVFFFFFEKDTFPIPALILFLKRPETPRQDTNTMSPGIGATKASLHLYQAPSTDLNEK